MESTTIVVTIGQNARARLDDGTLGQLPMSSDEWRRANTAVAEVVLSAGCPIYFAGRGNGHSEEWGEEEAYTVVAGWPTSDAALAGLRYALQLLAYAYGQDAIALTTGRTEFITRGQGERAFAAGLSGDKGTR